MIGRTTELSAWQNVVCEAVQREISRADVAVVRTALLRVQRSSERAAEEVSKGGGGTADEGAVHVKETAEEMGVNGVVGQVVVVAFALGSPVRLGEHPSLEEDHSERRLCLHDLSCVASSFRVVHRG